MSGLDLGRGNAVSALAERRRGSKREWFVIGVLALVPIPLLALSGIGLPLPSLVERGISAILPSGPPQSPVDSGLRTGATPRSSSTRPAPAHNEARATTTRHHSAPTQGGGRGPRPQPIDPTSGDPASAPGGTGDVPSGPSAPGSSGPDGGIGGSAGTSTGATIGASAGGASVGVSTSTSGTDTSTSVGVTAPDGSSVGVTNSNQSSGSSTTVGGSTSGTSVGVTVGDSDSGSSAGANVAGTAVTVPVP